MMRVKVAKNETNKLTLLLLLPTIGKQETYWQSSHAAKIDSGVSFKVGFWIKVANRYVRRLSSLSRKVRNAVANGPYV
jgi:hypothetical protein